jgi:hypothetical protein
LVSDQVSLHAWNAEMTAAFRCVVRVLDELFAALPAETFGGEPFGSVGKSYKLYIRAVSASISKEKEGRGERLALDIYDPHNRDHLPPPCI